MKSRTPIQRLICVQSCLAVALLLIGLCPSIAIASPSIWANAYQIDRDSAAISFEKNSHSFGRIAEEKGQVQCEFLFTNTGTAPLVITRVSADCGCTTPSWPQEAIPAGQSGRIGVYFNPAGRPGSFVKYVHIYTNASQAPVSLSLKGTVSTLGGGAKGLYASTIGSLEVSKDRLSFPTVSIGADAEMRLVLNNPTTESLRVRIKSTPSFVDADTTTRVLKAMEPTEYLLTLHSNAQQTKPDIYSDSLHLIVTDTQGRVSEGSVLIDAILADDFAAMIDDDQKPVMQLQTYFDLGTASPTDRAIDVKVNLHNAGTKPLIIHTVKSVEPSVEVIKFVRGLRISPGEDAKLHLRISPQKIAQESKEEVSTNVSILCNDPAAPLRRVRVKLKLKA